MSKKTETFDLNTAVSFLPEMDDTEEVTQRLISSIEMYDSLLDEESKPVLINFILTSRLSPSAKLRLTKKYKTVDHLINDMNKYLLPKKSFTVIQQQLSQCTQKDRDIDSYAQEIEKLFVDLTIAQADGDQNKYKIFRPVNEKMAIRQFANGLKNINLSTLIVARDYKSLKDAIQGAKDEQTSISLRNIDYHNHASVNNHPVMSRGHSQGPRQGQYNSQFNQSDHPFLWKESGAKHFEPQGIQVKNFDNRDGYHHSRVHCHSYRGNSRGGGHSVSHHSQGTPGKNLDNRDGNNKSQRGRGQNSGGTPHSTSNFGTHHNQGAPGKNSDNRSGHHQSQRGYSQNSRGASNSGNHHNQGAPRINSDNRDGNKQSQSGHGKTSSGNSRGANHAGTHQNKGTSNNNPVKSNNNNNQPKKAHDQSSRGNSQGSNQRGTHHNQGNRGKNSYNRGGNNNVGRPVINVPVPEFLVDCQFRFTAVAGSSNVKPANTSKDSGSNKNKQVAKK